MNLVDSSAWLEYFADGPNADFFAPAIERSQVLIVPTIVLYEVYKHVAAQRGSHAAMQAAATLQHGRMVELSAGLAVAAARISASEKLPLADSIIVASARAENAIIWTQGAHFERLSGVKFRAKKS